MHAARSSDGSASPCRGSGSLSAAARCRERSYLAGRGARRPSALRPFRRSSPGRSDCSTPNTSTSRSAPPATAADSRWRRQRRVRHVVERRELRRRRRARRLHCARARPRKAPRRARGGVRAAREGGDARAPDGSSGILRDARAQHRSIASCAPVVARAYASLCLVAAAAASPRVEMYKQKALRRAAARALRAASASSLTRCSRRGSTTLACSMARRAVEHERGGNLRRPARQAAVGGGGGTRAP